MVFKGLGASSERLRENMKAYVALAHEMIHAYHDDALPECSVGKT